MPSIQITCADCRQPFDYTDRDQEFYATNGWTPPKRCRPCRQARKAERDAIASNPEPDTWRPGRGRR